MTDTDQTKSPESGKVAVVTGAGGGIGKATAIALSAAGWRVAIAGRTAATLEQTISELPGEGIAVTCDVASERDVDQFFDRVSADLGRIDLLFNNAGIMAPAVPIDELDVQAWRDVIDINLTGSFLCARRAFADMRRQSPQGGRIINNGSVSATTPRPFSAPYTACKHAITGLTKSLALDGRTVGIACGQIDIGNVTSAIGDQIATGALQPNGSILPEPTMGLKNVTDAVLYMASLPPEANVLSLTVMSTTMPFVGRG